MHGVRFIQVQTTLLTIVDSSIGRRTAMYSLHGKNEIGPGCFLAPRDDFHSYEVSRDLSREGVH